jgi:hypothetical protein
MSGTPNKVIVGLTSLGARALRTRRWSQERRVWARCARESGACVIWAGASPDLTRVGFLEKEKRGQKKDKRS